MIIAHLSDLHLGYRAFGNVEQGRNIREADVARAFHQAIQKVVEIAPSVVLVAGDVFDRPEPPHSALVAPGYAGPDGGGCSRHAGRFRGSGCLGSV